MRIPPIGEPVTVRDDDGIHYRSRVEDADGDNIVLARPTDLAAGVAYEEGMTFDLTWHRDSGIHVLPVELVDSYTEGTMRLWAFIVTGDGWTEQRRDYVRVPVSGRVVLTPEEDPDEVTQSDSATPESSDDDAAPIEGQLIDVSEVAMQCSVVLPDSDPRVATGKVLNLRFAIGDDDFDIMGSVRIVRTLATTRDTRLVIQFAESEVISDAIRQHVFRIQLALRRQSRG